MKIGQMTLPRVSAEADYLQLDICSLSEEAALTRFLNYKTDKPIVLHGDWTKKGASENDLLKEERRQDYSEIIDALKKHTEIIGFTLHPPFRNKLDIDTLIEMVKELEEQTGIDFFIENRSNSKILVSTPEEIISLSEQMKMTIDIPQLYISCGYNENVMIDTLTNCHWDNIKELHFANIMRKDGRSYVARKLEDGVLDLTKLIPFVRKTPLITLEILGGNNTFEQQQSLLKSWVL